MRLLLDTHALVWFIDNDPQLPATARAAIQEPTNEVWISPASYWEIAIKVHTGKWTLNQPYPQLMNAILSLNQFQVLPILTAHTAHLIGLPDHHKDPFDRLLIAQALVEGLTLVSADAKFDLYAVPGIWA